jgi:hypothetical protein
MDARRNASISIRNDFNSKFDRECQAMHFWISTIAGILLTTMGVGETFMAVLYPRAINGPITGAINRLFHHLLQTRLIGQGRMAIAAGPVLIIVQVLCWATLLLMGVALMAWPQLGTGITATGPNPTDTDFASAIYYAGFTLTTLGVGDLVPRTPAVQILTITAAGLGFSFFTLVLAYVISVYSTLARRNQFANEIEYRTGRTGESTGYLTCYLTDSDPSLINQDLYALSSRMAELLESHHFYPVLHYYRFSESRYSMSRMLKFCLEISSMMRALRDIDPKRPSANAEAIDRLWHASLQMLDEATRHFVICDSSERGAETELAEVMIPHLGVSRDQGTQLVTAFAHHQSIWIRDLNKLAICTGTTPGKDS